MSDTNERDSRFGGDCEVEEHEGILVFKTLLGQGRTHFCFVSPSDLSYEKFVGGFEQARRDPHHGVDGIEIAPGVSYRIEKQKKRASNFFLTVDGKEHPLGRCRGGAVAACAEGKIFVYKNRTIDVYDRESMKPITNILALDIDRWMVCGVDKKGVVSLVKMEDVESVSGKGSSLKVLFARLKAPDFKLDVFEGCFVDLDMVWNLRFSLDVRDNIIFYYKRDGNRVKPLTLNRYMLKSGNMKRSSTMKADESKFEAKICELSDGRIAITSMDDMDGNLNVDPRITVRIMDINTGESNLCDISKKDESGHLDVSGIGETFVLSEDGHEYVVVQFASKNVPLVCSRDSVSRLQFPSEGGYVRGTVVDHDGETCIVKDPDGGFSRYSARLERVGDAADPEGTVKKAIRERSEVPLNKEIRMSFGSVMQNGGAFFCLRKHRDGF